jgi:hypothetical protein
MAYTKYSLTPANNTAAPPDGAPEGMLPSAVNDTMRDMMAQIRDCGDGIRDGTYTMTAAKITGGTITGVTLTGNTFSNPTVTGVSTFAAGTVSAPAITTTGDTNTGIFFPAADTIAFTEGGAEAMRIDSSGNLLVNTTTVRNSGKVSIDFAGNSAGGLGINDTDSVNGGVYASFLSGGTFRGSITNNNNTAVAYNTTSDYRLKENIALMTGALTKVAQLKPVTYVWKSNGFAGQGFIAHELQTVVPEAVTGEKDAVDNKGNPKYQGVDTSFLVATLTAAIQELNAKVDAQAVRIAELEAK